MDDRAEPHESELGELSLEDASRLLDAVEAELSSIARAIGHLESTRSLGEATPDATGRAEEL